MIRKWARLGLVLVPASLSMAVGCGGGVSTNASGASPTPTPAHTGTATPTPGQTPTPAPTHSGTPTPTPTGTPTAAAGTCSFVWLTDYTSFDGTLDFYEVDIDKTAWNNTTAAFDGTNVGYFITGYDPVTGTISFGAGMSIDGAISMNVGGMAAGDAVNFNDTESHQFYDAKDYFQGTSTMLGAPNATGGIGSFAGVLSNPDPSTPVDMGLGSVSVTDNTGITETYGKDSVQPTEVYSVCSQ